MKKCYIAVHGRYENEYTSLGCNKRKAIAKLKKLKKENPFDHFKLGTLSTYRVA